MIYITLYSYFATRSTNLCYTKNKLGMLYKNFYNGMSETDIEKMIRDEGFDPLKYSNGPGDIYPLHQHPETKILAFLSGSMEIAVSGEKFSCGKSDKLIIPGNIPHSAIVGPSGCTFFWSEKLI